jgi:hypothetical protein
MMILNTKKQPAGIEYSGQAGVSASCKEAIMRLLQYGDQITHARILSCSNDHCLLLTVNSGDVIAVKSGFTSGYSGEGPRTFSFVLRLLEAHGTEIEEYEVARSVIDRVDMSSLTIEDLANLEMSKPVRPTRWFNYVNLEHIDMKKQGVLWKHFPMVIPFAIIDSRITDLDLIFLERPDDILLTGYRRLEDIVRKRTGIDEHGTKLFSQAFHGDKAKLKWEGLSNSERDGRASLFTAAYMAFRNPRAHRELRDGAGSYMMEFLLLNYLYILEEQAMPQIK